MESARRYFLGTLPWHRVIDGVHLALLRGDPGESGEYVIRFRTDREIFVPLHWHPHDEHVRVVNGPFSLSINNQRSVLEAGSKVVIPAKAHHSTWYGAGTQIEVSGMGPFESIYVDLDTLEA